jgi:putative ABC transport system permease protein
VAITLCLMVYTPNSVLLFTLGIGAVTCFSFGLLPALQASKTDLQTSLKDIGRLTTARSPESNAKSLVIAEVSVSLVLLAGAGLLVRSMRRRLKADDHHCFAGQGNYLSQSSSARCSRNETSSKICICLLTIGDEL